MTHTPYIEWTDALQTGVAEIDSQHRVLVATLNEAGAKLAADHSGELFDQITKDLLGYAIYHFETEEGLMKQFGYAGPAAEHHLQEHRAFSARVASVRRNLQHGHALSREALLKFLNDWLVDHILGTDRHLTEFILGARRTDPPTP